MATDATGTPTSPDSIPKYNTAADAPSGLGFNASMDAIQVALSARAKAPVGIASGEAMIWNGVTFVRSSVTGLTPSGIAGYPADGTKVLKGDGTWAVAASTTYGITLPVSPVDGQTAILVDSITLPTYQWTFRWNAGSSNADKWEFVGGAPAQVSVATSESTTSITYVALATAGPNFALPRAGVYQIEQGFNGGESTGGTGGFMSYDIGGTGAVDSDAAVSATAGATSTSLEGSGIHSVTKTGLTAITLTPKYRARAAFAQFFAARFIRVTPLRVS